MKSAARLGFLSVLTLVAVTAWADDLSYEDTVSLIQASTAKYSEFRELSRCRFGDIDAAGSATFDAGDMRDAVSDGDKVVLSCRDNTGPCVHVEEVLDDKGNLDVQDVEALAFRVADPDGTAEALNHLFALCLQLPSPRGY